MSDKKITIEVDGLSLDASNGEMLIEVTDREGIYIPRFCYHEKLSVAANCRMCLVEMEKGRKPMPACATPVGDGMKFFTRSRAAIDAQRATMEFLLINHPLDCPICDQGGECELQDLAMGYGRGISRYAETKRVIQDKEIGPLVSTDMTRCIQCTRCVRFGQEIAGIQELGTIGRGENVEIAPYIETTVDHELSGNIIDLCPVGALNSKPFRFRARSWEMTQVGLISPHDSFGSNLYAHVLRGKVMRVVPHNNESINETWISDRDRFSYEGIYSSDRVTRPMIRRGEEWVECDWATALGAAAEGMRKVVDEDPAQLGVLSAPWATVEELHQITNLAHGLGCANVDHRLRRQDFSDQHHDAAYPGLAISLGDIDHQDAVLLLGCRPRQEVPMLAHRIRKAARNGAKVMVANQEQDKYLFPLQAEFHGQSVLEHAASLAKAAGASAEGEVDQLIQNAAVTDAHREAVEAMRNAEQSAVFLGATAIHHPAYTAIRACASALAKQTGSSLNIVGDSANAAGAALVGALPHRQAASLPAAVVGLNAGQMLTNTLRAYLLFGFEAEADTAAGVASLPILEAAEHVVCVTSYLTDAIKSYASVILPLASFAESAGTYVNCEGKWQSFTGAGLPLGDARPGWKILRVLGNQLALDGFDFNSPSDVLEDARQKVGDIAIRNEFTGSTSSVESVAVTNSSRLYQSDPVVRRSAPLQAVGVKQEAAPLKATA